jgi:hypothetical protein
MHHFSESGFNVGPHAASSATFLDGRLRIGHPVHGDLCDDTESRASDEVIMSIAGTSRAPSEET